MKIRVGDLTISITAPVEIEVEVEDVAGEKKPGRKEITPVKVSKKEIPNILEPEIESMVEESPAPKKLEPVKNSEKPKEAEEVLNEFFKENDKQASALKSALEEEKKEDDSDVRQTLEELLGA